MPQEGAVIEAPVEQQAQVQAPVQEGASADLENMSIEELEKKVDAEAVAPAQQAPTAQEKPKDTQTAQPISAEEYKALQDKLAGYEREAPRWRAVQAQMQRVEAQQRADAVARQEAQRQAQLANLSPEDREAQALALQQREEFSKAVQAELQRVLQGDQYKPYLSAIDEMRQEKQDQGHLMEAAQAAEGLAPGSSAKVESLWKKNAQELESPDDNIRMKAAEWFDKASSNPHFLALELARSYMSDVKGKAADEEKRRSTSAAQAGQTIGAGRQVVSSGKKPVNEMSQAELDAMPIDELEKAIPAQ